MSDKVYSVSDLNERVKMLIDSDEIMAGVYVRGELSNYKMYPSGHHYFTMKDQDGALKCVMFKSSASKLKYQFLMSITTLYKVVLKMLMIIAICRR